MNRLSWLRLFPLSLVLVATLALGASTPYPSSPKEVMERYLSLDAEAAGLAPGTWPELGQYTTFAQAPQWQAFMIIDHYEIGKTMEGHTRAQIHVTYYPLGKMSDKFSADTKPETVVFYMNKVKDQWKVDSPPLMPHVSFDVMQKRLKGNDALIAQILAARGH